MTLSKNTSKISDRIFNWTTLLLYTAVTTGISMFHEVWRDEVTPLTLAIQSTSLQDVFIRLHNYGHPFLWSSLLYGAYQLFHSYLVLKPVNLLISAGAVYIFLSRSPFSRLQKVLFVAGFFPLYLYPVINRNYGISMLLCFATASLYPRRFEKMIPLGIVLFLLANAHAHSLVITLAITVMLGAELLFSPGALAVKREKRLQVWAMFFLIFSGITASMLQIIPDPTSIIFRPDLSMRHIVLAITQSLTIPGKVFPSVLGAPSTIFPTVVIFFMAVYLSRKPYLLFFFISSVFGLNLFFHLFHPSFGARHQGAFFLLLIMTFWMDRCTPEKKYAVGIFEDLKRYTEKHADFLFTLLLVLQVGMTYPPVKDDILHNYSSGKSLGQFLSQDPRFKEAILVGEPDIRLESLPYYTDNPFYILREKKFARYVKFDSSNRREYSLEELLNDAKKLKADTGKPVLVAIGHPLSPEGPFKISFSYDKLFTYSKDSLENFMRQTTFIRGFHGAISDENYDIYEVL